MSSRIPTSYADYLQSEDWKVRRDRALYLAQHRCQSPTCELGHLRSWTDAELATLPRNRYRLEVHHLTYERLGREHPDDLIVLCRACHAAQHGVEYTTPPDLPPGPVPIIEAVRRAFERMTENIRRGPPLDDPDA